jgi:N-acetylglutamate synthase
VRESAFLDELMANAWPPEVTEHVGRSQLRWASGFTRRANSCLCIGEDEQVDEIVARSTEFYSIRHAVPAFLVSTASAPPSMSARLQALGFELTARTLLQTAPSASVAAAGTDAGGWDVLSTAEPTDAWFETYWAVESSRNRDDSDRRVCRSMLGGVGRAAHVALVEAGETIAVGQIVVEQGWAGVQCMATHPRHRRRGAAGVVLRCLAQKAVDLDAANMYLAVAHANTGAQGLYERAGFSAVHEYSYAVPSRP